MLNALLGSSAQQAVICQGGKKIISFWPPVCQFAGSAPSNVGLTVLCGTGASLISTFTPNNKRFSAAISTFFFQIFVNFIKSAIGSPRKRVKNL